QRGPELRARRHHAIAHAARKTAAQLAPQLAEQPAGIGLRREDAVVARLLAALNRVSARKHEACNAGPGTRFGGPGTRFGGPGTRFGGPRTRFEIGRAAWRGR